MRLTAFFVALLLCAHSFKVDAGVGKGTWLRNALRATTAQVNGMLSKVKSSVGIPLVIVLHALVFTPAIGLTFLTMRTASSVLTTKLC